MDQKLIDLSVAVMTLKSIKDKCTNEILQYCLFESVHNNKVIPALNYYYLRKLEEVQRLETLLEYKSLDTYIKVLDKLTNELISIIN